MANKIKDTVEYFPFFVRDGRTLFILQKKYGLAGIGFFTQILRWLAQSPGHYYPYVEDFDKDRFNEYCGLTENEIRVMIGDMVRSGKLDKDLWEERNVIYSEDFVQELSELYRRRKVKLPSRENVIAETDGILTAISGNMTAFSQDCQNHQEIPEEYETAAICRQYVGNMTRTPEQSRVEESIESIGEVETAQPEPPAESLPAVQSDSKQSKDIAPMKDDLAQMWQEMITRVQPHTSWSNYGKERSQVNQLAKKTRALYKETPYTNEGDLAKAVFSQFLEMRQTGNDKRIRGTPVIPSRIVQFWPEVVTALADQYQAAEAAEEYDPEEIIF
ncbi:hypothetical protein B4O97_03550 [Marispirochaeta aestuarii]|uniref:Lin1244/Lin1753-like N-terminal domain-containing protein n=1 Tax=Marispirochaeta aestuarii TaxID=1963862 RepID=A0A1Y1S196_9SPIO|nr:DUF4373 domain-containing protein [Marispirochaeta aestuarii]ORC37278.1 hypothetical protein B4O97_03550 [Marispirochaeta aestuarii]